MLALRQYSLAGSLVLISLLACDGRQPLEPPLQAASTGRAGPAVKAPSNTNAVVASESRIDVSWQDNSTNETGFEVHRSTTGASGVFALLASTGAGLTSYSDAGLASATEYCYKVRAFRTADGKTVYSGFSTAACATTPAPPVPPVPTAPSGADAKPENSTAVVVRWSDNSTDEDGFQIERSLDLGTSWTTAGTEARNGTLFVDSGRTSDQHVCYRVAAFNAWVSSAPSNTDCTAPPAAPTNLAVAGPGLTWTDNSAVEDGYVVLAWVAVWWPEGGWAWEWRLIAELPPNSTSVTTACELECTFYVAARNDAGISDWAQVYINIGF